MTDRAARHRHQLGLVSAVLVGYLGVTGPAGAQTYTVIKLRTLGGGSSHVTGINNVGQIVGYSATREAVTHAFRYEDGTITDLGTLGGPNSYATGINSAGQVVGYSDLSRGAAQHATLWIGATAIDLGTSGGAYSFAYAINDAGEIAGSTSTAALGPHAARWIGSTLSDISSDPASFSVARAINSSGQIVGQQNDPEPLGYVWNGPTASQLAAGLGDGESDAYAINAKGQVAGWAQVSLVALAPEHAVRWSSTTVPGATDLGTLGGTSSTGLGINAVGHVVGWADTSTGDRHATLWIGNRAKDLNQGLIISRKRSVVLTDAAAINDHGWIVVNGVDIRTNQPSAYVLLPQSNVCGADRQAGRQGHSPRDADNNDRAGAAADSSVAKRAPKPSAKVGMSELQVLRQTVWGAPRTVSAARMGGDLFDLWSYGDGRYLTFVNDCLAGIHD